MRGGQPASVPGQPSWCQGDRVTLTHPGGDVVTVTATSDLSPSDPRFFLNAGAGWYLTRVEAPSPEGNTHAP